MGRRGLALVLCAIPQLGAAQQRAPVPTFSSETEVITIDAVVVSKDGTPVRGLTQSDFQVYEDGRPQTTVVFKAREVADLVAPPSPDEQSPASVASNLGSAAHPARIMAILVDDLGISGPVMAQVKRALGSWIREKAGPLDEITITTSSGDLWWSDTVERGRADLLSVLEQVQARAVKETAHSGGMTDWEALQLSEVQRDSGGSSESRGAPTMGDANGTSTRTLGSSMLDRVVQRYLDLHLCDGCPSDCALVRCKALALSRAQEVHTKERERQETVLGAIARLSHVLGAAPGRKSILLVSEEMIEDPSVGLAFRKATQASYVGDTAVYFLAARGLTGPSMFSVEQDSPPRDQDVGMMMVEEGTLATGGGEALAEATGGTLTKSNDLAAGLDRVALDASSYYLLGYRASEPPDGKWHKLKVDVQRPGVTVRARRTYRAVRRADGISGDREPEDGRGEGAPVTPARRPLPLALLAGAARSGIPIRLAAEVRDNNHAGLARVRTVVEIDNGHVPVDTTSLPWKTTLDVTILVAGLGRPPQVPVDQRIRLTLTPGEVGSGWWMLTRDVWLPPGVAQVRVSVRDVGGTAQGVATERIVVPDVDQPYLSTPILTDRTLPSENPTDPPRLVPTANRQFGERGPLYCQFEVFTFGGQGLPGVPRLRAGYVLQGPEGRIVSNEVATPIETEGPRAVRRIVLPIDALEDGPYVLSITVEDALAGRTLEDSVPFVIRRTEPEERAQKPMGDRTGRIPRP